MMNRSKLFVAVIAVGTFLMPASSRPQSQPSNGEPQYSYAVHQDHTTGHFIVDITNASQVTLLCQVHYSGHNSINAEVSGQRTIVVRPSQDNTAPSVASTHFAQLCHTRNTGTV